MTQDQRGHPHVAPTSLVVPTRPENGESPGPVHVRHSTRVPISCVDMKLPLSVDATIVVRARKAAAALGLSLNQAVRNFLSDLADHSRREVVSAEVARLSHQAQADREGWQFDREQIHERP